MNLKKESSAIVKLFVTIQSILRKLMWPRKQSYSTFIVLFVVLCTDEAKGSTNKEDLDTIYQKFDRARLNANGLVIELLSTMKKEQQGFETELDSFLKSNPNAPDSMKTMLTGQKGMQDEVNQVANDVKEYKDHFQDMSRDVFELKQSNDDTAIYNGCKPYIIKLEPMTDQFKVISQQLGDISKKYQDFGQIMIDSQTTDKTISKRLCKLGEVIKKTAKFVSDIGDLIAVASEKIGDVWQRINPGNTDNNLVEVSKELVPKGKELVSDGGNQASDGQKLMDMCEMVGRAKVAVARTTKHPFEDDVKEHMGDIIRVLESIDEDLERLRLKLIEIKKSEEEVESKIGGDLTSKELAKEAEDMKLEVEKLKLDFRNLIKDIKGTEWDSDYLGRRANKNVQLMKKLMELSKKLEIWTGKVLSNGKDLKVKKIFSTDIKPMFDVLGKQIEEAGNVLNEMGEHHYTSNLHQYWHHIASFTDSPVNVEAEKASMKTNKFIGEMKEYAVETSRLGVEIQQLTIYIEGEVETTPKPNDYTTQVETLSKILEILTVIEKEYLELEEFRIKAEKAAGEELFVEEHFNRYENTFVNTSLFPEKPYPEFIKDIKGLMDDFKNNRVKPEIKTQVDWFVATIGRHHSRVASYSHALHIQLLFRERMKIKIFRPAKEAHEPLLKLFNRLICLDRYWDILRPYVDSFVRWIINAERWDDWTSKVAPPRKILTIVASIHSGNVYWLNEIIEELGHKSTFVATEESCDFSNQQRTANTTMQPENITCCESERQSLVEIRTLLIIFLELLGGCEE